MAPATASQFIKKHPLLRQLDALGYEEHVLTAAFQQLLDARDCHADDVRGTPADLNEMLDLIHGRSTAATTNWHVRVLVPRRRAPTSAPEGTWPGCSIPT